MKRLRFLWKILSHRYSAIALGVLCMGYVVYKLASCRMVAL